MLGYAILSSYFKNLKYNIELKADRLYDEMSSDRYNTDYA